MIEYTPQYMSEITQQDFYGQILENKDNKIKQLEKDLNEITTILKHVEEENRGWREQSVQGILKKARMGIPSYPISHKTIR